MLKKVGPALERGAKSWDGVETNKANAPDWTPSKGPLRAELFDSDRCTALGLVAVSPSPVLLLCRMLVDSGVDPRAALEAWRGPVLCLLVRSIGEASGLEVAAHGVGFRPKRPPCERGTAPSARFGGSPYSEAAE
jgi:hypothetical protein